MLSYTFSEISYSLFSGITLIGLWALYYMYINTITVPQVQSTDVKTKKLPPVLSSISVITFGLLLLWGVGINYLYIHSFSTHNAFWDAIYISNNAMTYFYLALGILLTILLASLCLIKQNVSFTSEYLIFICIIILFSHLLISSTNLFLTIFLLELVALLIFGKFAVSRALVNLNKVVSERSGPLFINQFSYGLFNSLFFQFWANFVSSIFLFFSIINIHYILGASNFFLVNYFYSLFSDSLYLPNLFTSFNVVILTTGLFIKLGLSPYQFFKIETYKGIPLFMVVVYTTLYLIVYIYFFLYLFLQQVPAFRDFIGSYLLVALTVSIFYLVSLLFDTKNFKAFLSYSTLITVINLFAIVILI